MLSHIIMKIMNILFIHQNFPGQFKYLAPSLAHDGHRVVALSARPHNSTLWNGIELVTYAPQWNNCQAGHPWLSDFSTKLMRAEACLAAAKKLKLAGFIPDLVIAHPGWGESLFIKDLWPNTKLALYSEFHYQSANADVGFDPEFPTDPLIESQRIKLKNINNFLHYQDADAGISPTYWQKNSFPSYFRKKITVIHDGIDTNFFKPDPHVKIMINTHDGELISLSKENPIITYSARNLEPYRGFHIFMRSLPQILRDNPKARVLILGNDGISYGNNPDSNHSWKKQLISEISDYMSSSMWARVHFLGTLSVQDYLKVLQVSALHIYLTYPFVLSWGLLEAMSCSCRILASSTAPVNEVINKGNGHLFNFFDHVGLAEKATELLNSPSNMVITNNAREKIISTYNLTASISEQKKWVHTLMDPSYLS